MERQKLIFVDSRGRTNLQRVRTQHHERYLAQEEPDGTIILTPAVTIPASLLAPAPDPEMAVA